jgi:hypothetical protein
VHVLAFRQSLRVFVCDAADIFHHEGHEAKREGFKPAPTNPNFFANFAFFAANSLIFSGCGLSHLAMLV